MKILQAIAVSVVLFHPILAYASDTERVFREAVSYTVRIETVIKHAFIEEEQGAGEGAGFVIDVEKGWILTNAHVVGRSPSVFKVAFHGGEEQDSEKVYVDPILDVAVIRPVDPLPAEARAAPVECEKRPAVGHPVGAFGHPWSLSFTGTRGIVSGSTTKYGGDWLQTDAPINAGNSGGPLISLESGKVIGINSAGLDPKETNNLGFVVPMEYACGIVDLLRAGSDPSPPRIPFAFLSDKETDDPLTVASVAEGSGSIWRPGDALLRLQGQSELIRSEAHLLHLLRGRTGVQGVVVDREGESITLPLPLTSLPSVLERAALYFSGALIAAGTFRNEMDTFRDTPLLVQNVEPGSYAQLESIEAWQFIEAVDGKRFSDVRDLYAYLKSVERSKSSVEIYMKAFSADDGRLFEYKKATLPVEGLVLINESS